LSDGDQITVGDSVFKFRQPGKISEEYKTILAQQTLRQVENVSCWLLVADIRNFTPLSRSMQSEGVEALLGAWISTCKEIIEKHNGIINKYLGDGFLAYWPDAETKPEEIAAVICALKELQQKSTPDFRIVVHFGPVAIGGIASMGGGKFDGQGNEFDLPHGKASEFLGRTLRPERTGTCQAGKSHPVASGGGIRAEGFREKVSLLRCLAPPDDTVDFRVCAGLLGRR
jgi:hypothetical protein